MNSQGQRGNITYIYVRVRTDNNNCIVPICNLVTNGSFEEVTGSFPVFNQIWKACNWSDTSSFGTADLLSISPGLSLIGDGGIIPVNGNNFTGIYTDLFTNSPERPREVLGTDLGIPLRANTSYTLSFSLRLRSTSNSSIAFQALLANYDITCIVDYNSDIPELIGQEVFIENTTQSINKTDWQRLTFTFNTGNISNLKYLYLGNIRNVNRQFLNPSLNNDLTNSYYYIDNIILNEVVTPPTFDLPATICPTATIDNLADTIAGAINNNVTFTGNGVTLTGGVFTFDAAVAGLGDHELRYNYFLTPNCLQTIVKTITVGPCGNPFISQTYVDGTNTDRFIEIKNKSNVAFPIKTYYLAAYNYGDDLNAPPTQFIELPAMAGLETIVFGDLHAQNPAYAVARMIPLPTNFQFNGKQILIITTDVSDQSYANRVDLAGTWSVWCNDISLVRSSCATNYPRTDLYDRDDWAEYRLDAEQIIDENSKTNAVLGVHHHKQLTYNPFFEWEEDNLPVNSSLPDKSREVYFNNNYNLGVFGDLEVCSLRLNGGVTVTVPATFYISAEISVTVELGATLDVQNGGALVMVKDSYNGVSGQMLTNGAINVIKRTNGLDSGTDVVYWSTPLTLASNPVINNLFNPNIFASNYFYTGINANFYDGYNFNTNSSGTDGYDDNNDFWFNFTVAYRQDNKMTPGQGYAVLAPTTPVITLQNPTGYNYDINFVGEANNGIINVPTWKNDSFAGINANLVGNPYPSAIDLDKLFAVNTNLIYPFAGIWGRTPVDGVTPSNGPYGYLNYFNPDNYCIYSPTMTIPSGNSTFTNILSSCQAFFVKTIKDAPSQLLNTGFIQPAGNLVFNNSMRTTNTTNTFARMANNTTDEKTKIWIAIKESAKVTSVEAGIAFLDKGDDKFNENEDVKCFYGNPLNIYTIADKTDLVINALSKFDDNKMIALGFNNFTESNRLSISVAKTTGELADHVVYLLDKTTSKIVNISKESYNFVSEFKTDDARFTILFQNKLAGELGDTDNNKVIIFAKDGIVTVNSLTDKKIQSVYVSDIYTPSIGGIEIAKNENINNKQYRFTVDKERYKLLNITVVLEDGTIVNKKVIP